MPDPRSQILLHQLGDIPALGHLAQLSSAVGRVAFRSNALRARVVTGGPTQTLATPVGNAVVEPASKGLLPRNSVASPMDVDTRYDGGVDPATLADHLRSIEGGSMATSGMTTPEIVDVDMASPSEAPGGETVRSPARSVPQTPGGPVGTTTGGAGTVEAPAGYAEIIDRLAAQLQKRMAEANSPKPTIPTPSPAKARQRSAHDSKRPSAISTQFGGAIPKDYKFKGRSPASVASRRKAPKRTASGGKKGAPRKKSRPPSGARTPKYRRANDRDQMEF